VTFSNSMSLAEDAGRACRAKALPLWRDLASLGLVYWHQHHDLEEVR
jgi:hypothetical protein